ncbi:MAG: AAA family ATPase [Clostridia bacterium]|jgi:ATP-dependent 26S proteasome regulatory subunit
MTKFQDDLVLRIRAGFGLFYVTTHEEKRLINDAIEIAKQLKYNLFLWSRTKGLVHRVVLDADITYDVVTDQNTPVKNLTKTDLTDPMDVMPAVITSLPERSLVFLLDFYHFLDDVDTVRSCKDAVELIQNESKKVFFVGAQQKIPLDIERNVLSLEYPMPDNEDIEHIISFVEQCVKTPIEHRREKYIDACKGLITSEIEDALTFAFVKNNAGKDIKQWDDSCIETVYKEKKQIIKKSGILEFVETNDSLDDIGGLYNLKSWLKLRQKAFTPEARKFGIKEPKGLLLVGPPGTGKSLVARTITRMMMLPCLRLDMGKVFNKYVGQSEENLRNAISIAESISPSILWIDEIDKGLSSSNGTEKDGGSSARVLGTILTWMSEKTKPVFVIATANKPWNLDTALLRKGRFDEIFMVDIPNEEERQQIFQIHLQKNNIDQCGSLDVLAKSTDGFSGAEIEQCVLDSMFLPFVENRKVGVRDLLASINKTKPQSQTMTESLGQARVMLQKIAQQANAVGSDNTIANGRQIDM